MKKIFVIALASVLILSACSGATQLQEKVEVVEESSVADNPESAESSTEEPASTTEVDEKALLDEINLVVGPAKEFISSLEVDPELGSFPMPTNEDFAKIDNAMATAGFPVSSYSGNMLNNQPALDFIEKVEAKQDGSVTIYKTYNWGIVGNSFSTSNGEVEVISVVQDFPSTDNPEMPQPHVDAFSKQKAEVTLTENGYLMVHIPPQGEYSESDYGFRVIPLNQEFIELSEKYVKNLSYVRGGLLKENWSEQDLSALDLTSIFAELYYRENNKLPAEDAPNPEAETMQIPSDVVDALLTASMPITVEEIRSKPAEKDPHQMTYDSASDEYSFPMYILSGGFSTPEVVGATNNEDGTITLTVNSVALMFGHALETTNELTVSTDTDPRPTYLSNKVVYTAPFMTDETAE